MLTGILILALVTFMAVISYKKRRFEERLVKQIPVIDWLLMFVFPIAFYLGLLIVVRNIVIRQRIEILDFDDIQLFGIGIFFMIFAFVGNSVHFVSKVLSRYIKKDKKSKEYQVNEIFHGKLSHYITFACSYMVVFILALLEINYPSLLALNSISIVSLVGAGILAGFSAFKGIFYTHQWKGGFNKPFFLISVVFLAILTGIFKSSHLSAAFYPLNVFIISMFFTVVSIYAIRIILIYSKLSGKRRLRFISRLFSMT